MHELSITESILRIAKSELEKSKAKKIINIKIKVGELSGVVPDLMQEYFNIVTKGTEADGAKLIVDKVPIVIKCLDCGDENLISKMKMKCPKCESVNLKMISGKEFYIDSMEVE